MKLARILLVTALICTISTGACLGKSPSGKEALGTYQYYDLMEALSIHDLDVVEHFKLAYKYNTPERKEAFRKTDEHEKKLNELKALRDKSVNTVYSTAIFKKVLTPTSPNLLQFYVNDIYIPGYPFAITDKYVLVNKDDIPWDNVIKNKYYLQSYDVPVSADDLAKLDNIGDLSFYLAFKVVGKKVIAETGTVKPNNTVLSVKPLRFLAISNATDEVLIDKTLE